MATPWSLCLLSCTTNKRRFEEETTLLPSLFQSPIENKSTEVRNRFPSAKVNPFISKKIRKGPYFFLKLPKSSGKKRIRTSKCLRQRKHAFVMLQQGVCVLFLQRWHGSFLWRERAGAFYRRSNLPWRHEPNVGNTVRRTHTRNENTRTHTTGPVVCLTTWQTHGFEEVVPVHSQ